MITTRGEVTVIKHREFISDVDGTVAYTATAYPVNPGQSVTFPWLSAIAKNYEKYRFRSLKFCFESATSSNTAGLTILAVDLDSSDPTPASKAQIMQYKNASRANAWLEHCTILPEMVPELYVRPGALPTNTDIKTYDAGNLFYAASQFAADGFAGELYAEYEVELHVPQSLAGGPSAVQSVQVSGAATLTTISQGTLRTFIETGRRFGVQAIPGQAFLFVWKVSGGSLSADISAPTVGGSAGTLSGVISRATDTTLGTVIEYAEFVATSVTNSLFVGGPGLFMLEIGNTTGPTSQRAVVTPVEPMVLSVSEKKLEAANADLLARIARLEERCFYQRHDSESSFVGNDVLVLD